MPYLVAACAFNPPVITITGAQLLPETIECLEKSLPLCTTTSQSNTCVANGHYHKFDAINTTPNTVRISLSQHYCDQVGRCAMISDIMSTLQQEGWEMRTTNALETADDKDVTRLFFWRQN